MGLYTNKAWKSAKEKLKLVTANPCTEIDVTLSAPQGSYKTTYAMFLKDTLEQQGFSVLLREEFEGKTLLYACRTATLIPTLKEREKI